MWVWERVGVGVEISYVVKYFLLWNCMKAKKWERWWEWERKGVEGNSVRKYGVCKNKARKEKRKEYERWKFADRLLLAIFLSIFIFLQKYHTKLLSFHIPTSFFLCSLFFILSSFSFFMQLHKNIFIFIVAKITPNWYHSNFLFLLFPFPFPFSFLFLSFCNLQQNIIWQKNK